MRRLTLALLLVVIAQPVQAVCVVVPLAYLLAEEDFAVVFTGTVREVHTTSVGQVATFAVDRVWKGQLSNRETIYNLQDIEPEDFKEGRRYLVFGYKQSAAERERFGLVSGNPATLGTNGCSVHPADGANAERILGDAPGYPPFQKP